MGLGRGELGGLEFNPQNPCKGRESQTGCTLVNIAEAEMEEPRPLTSERLYQHTGGWRLRNGTRGCPLASTSTHTRVCIQAHKHMYCVKEDRHRRLHIE